MAEMHAVMTDSAPYPDSGQDLPHDTDADRMVETPETLRDVDPEAPPMDRGVEASDRPLGAEKHGTTHAEAAEGESLDDRLAEEVPDVGAHDPVDDVVADHPETFAQDAADATETDEAVLDDAYGDDSAGGLGDPREDAGRLVEPDEGAHTDTEKDLVAEDVGVDGGDLSAEEAAVHIEEAQ
jgi:hypothetical protein